MDTQTEVVSDVRELVPRDLQALKDVNELQEETGVSGEIDVTVRADDITRPEVIAWMTSFQQGALKAAGYEPGDTCRQEKDPPELCPALSLPDIFRSVDPSDQRQVNALLDAVPAYFSQGVVTEDRKTANLAFGIRLQSLEDQKRGGGRPQGAARPARGRRGLGGRPAGAGGRGQRRARPRPGGAASMLVGALLAVFLVLLGGAALAARRGRPADPDRPRHRLVGRGAVPARAAARARFEVEPNPMSITLGALVVAISTEFSVLLSARYRQEREAGAAPAAGDRADLRLDRAPRCWPRARPPSPASPR